MEFEEQVAEAAHVISSLWMPGLAREVADAGIITEIASGEAAIVSSADGEVLWCGGKILGLSWALAFIVAAKKVADEIRTVERVNPLALALG